MTFGPYAKVAVEYADTKVGGLHIELCLKSQLNHTSLSQ